MKKENRMNANIRKYLGTSALSVGLLLASGISGLAQDSQAVTPHQGRVVKGSLDLGRPSKNSAAVATNARNKELESLQSRPMDAIEVVGHIALAGAPVTHFVCTEHYNSDYLYAERGAGKDITLIDVTKTEQPSVLANVPDAPDGSSESLVAVAGTAALVSTEQGTPAAATTPQTLRIMDFSDPQHPKVAREFTGVTAIGRYEKRGLVFVADSAGIWILRQHLAQDPKVEEEYSRTVLYNQ
jgi:hypothetical protein